MKAKRFLILGTSYLLEAIGKELKTAGYNIAEFDEDYNGISNNMSDATAETDFSKEEFIELYNDCSVRTKADVTFNLPQDYNKALEFAKAQLKVSWVVLPKFIKGKWYKNLGSDNSYYGKFNYFASDSFICDEYIHGKSHYFTPESNLTAQWKKAVLCTKEEIQEFLPKGHPERIVKKWGVGTYAVFVVAYGGHDKGTIGKIISDNTDTVKVKQPFHDNADNNCNLFKDRGGMWFETLTEAKAYVAKTYSSKKDYKVGDCVVNGSHLGVITSIEGEKYRYWGLNMCDTYQETDYYFFDQRMSLATTAERHDLYKRVATILYKKGDIVNQKAAYGTGSSNAIIDRDTVNVTVNSSTQHENVAVGSYGVYNSKSKIWAPVVKGVSLPFGKDTYTVFKDRQIVSTPNGDLTYAEIKAFMTWLESRPSIRGYKPMFVSETGEERMYVKFGCQRGTSSECTAILKALEN